MMGARSMPHQDNANQIDSSISPRAAQYVRMSRDHQKYSTQNQSETRDAVDRLLPLAVSAMLSQLGVSSYEKRQTTFLDDSRCANLEVTGSEENPRRQNREDAKAHRGSDAPKGV